MKYYQLAILGLFCFLSSCSSDQDQIVFSNKKSDIKAYNLIEPKLANNLLTKYPDKYIPIQVSKVKPFLKEHILGAKNIWRPDYDSGNNEPFGGLIPSQNKVEKLLQSFGFIEGCSLLLYDLKANVDAFRFAWVLNLYGFDDFKIINGGLKYWKLNGFEVSNNISSTAKKSDYQLSKNFDKSMIAEFDEVLEAIQDSNTILIDTRETYEYEGMPFIFKDTVLSYKKGAFNRGSIPSSIHFNWSTLADLSGDHRIKSEKDLRYDLDRKGIASDKNIILYCHSGSRTSHTYYVLKHVLGYENVKNYDGSWIEWSYKHSIDSSVPLLQICPEDQFEKIKNSLTKGLNKNE